MATWGLSQLFRFNVCLIYFSFTLQPLPAANLTVGFSGVSISDQMESINTQKANDMEIHLTSDFYVSIISNEKN